MFDIAPTELLLCAVVALLVIGPKDLPKAMRVVGHWVGRARGMARHFRSGIDTMIRESELAEMEKRWADENERIMREHPNEPLQPVDRILPPPLQPGTIDVAPGPAPEKPEAETPADETAPAPADPRPLP